MIPHAMERLEEWRDARRHAGRMLVALDFDGTLAPIVERPELAALPASTEEALARLARRQDTDVAVVSGRALEDVRARVGLRDIFYAGNHGLEIEGPGLHEIHREAAAARPAIAACAESLRHALAGIDGVIVEDKGLTLSVHYRLVADEAAAERVREAVSGECAERPGLRLTRGKKVVEIRPDVAWDKGRATRFLLAALEAGGAGAVPALFIGDDETDEDAFRAIREAGAGVRVADPPPSTTAATAYLRSTQEVEALIDALAREGAVA